MYLFNKEQNEIKSLIRKYVNEKIEKNANDRINSKVYPADIIDELGQMGYFGMNIPQEFAGAGLDAVTSMIIINEISKSDPSIGHIIAGFNFGICYPLLVFGTDEQKEKYLVPCAKGEKIGALAHNEPDGASMGQIKTVAVRDGDYYILNGTKSMITSANVADFALVFAKTDNNTIGHPKYNLFIVDLKDCDSIVIGKNEETMGLDSLKIADIAFNNVRVHKSNILGTVGEGFKVIIKTMELMRIANAAVSLGIAERAYYEALDYSKMRKISNSPMCNMQIMQYKLANMKSALQIMNISTFYPAYLFDLNPSYVEFDSSVAKYFVTEKAKEVCDIALQMFGGYGYIKGYTVERLYRDVRIMTILGGTSELIQAIISFGILQGKYK